MLFAFTFTFWSEGEQNGELAFSNLCFSCTQNVLSKTQTSLSWLDTSSPPLGETQDA